MTALVLLLVSNTVFTSPSPYPTWAYLFHYPICLFGNTSIYHTLSTLHQNQCRTDTPTECLLKAMFYWDLLMKEQLYGQSSIIAVWIAVRISCKSCRWDYSKCCSAQSRAELSWAVVLLTTPVHVSSIVSDCHTVTERNYLQLLFTKLFLHLKKQFLLFTSILPMSILQDEPHGRARFCTHVILNTKLVLWQQPKHLLQELDPLWWRGWWTGSVTLSQSSLLSQASWVPCLCRDMMKSSRTPGAWWI